MKAFKLAPPRNSFDNSQAPFQICRMVAVNSTMLPLGTKAPDFRLLEPAAGKTVSRSDFENVSALLVIFMCNHCPFVKDIRSELAKLARDYQARGIAMVGINS